MTAQTRVARGLRRRDRHAGHVPYAGADVAAGRWVGVLLDDRGRFASAHTAATMAELVAEMQGTAQQRGGVLRVLGVDIPIGLPERERRRCDVTARRVLGPRASSVFVTPPRAALAADSYAAASAVNRRLTGEGLSRQAYALRARIFDVEQWLATAPSAAVLEVHPEVSFAQLTGAPMPHPKRTWSGAAARFAALRAAGIVLPGDLGAAGAVGAVDDLLDAAAAAWTAYRYPSTTTYPGDPAPGEPAIHA